jgi:hypothetical protein
VEIITPLHYHNVLLLVAIVMCMAIDTFICERGFSLMNLLKTAKRSTMVNELLRILMTVCSLGKDAGWDDPTKIPIEDTMSSCGASSPVRGSICKLPLLGSRAGLLDALATAQNT